MRAVWSSDRLIVVFCVVAIAAALAILPPLTGWGVAGAVAGLLLVGGVFWLRSDGSRDTEGELGKLLMWGLAASLPGLVISHSVDERQRSFQSAFQARQRAQDLQLQIGFKRDLANVNL